MKLTPNACKCRLNQILAGLNITGLQQFMDTLLCAQVQVHIQKQSEMARQQLHVVGIYREWEVFRRDRLRHPAYRFVLSAAAAVVSDEKNT